MRPCTLITGASRRIGRAIADACLARGEQVVAHRRQANSPHHPDVPGAIHWEWDLDGPLPALPAAPITHLVLNASRFERGEAWKGLQGAAHADEGARLQRHWQTNVLASWTLATALAARAPLQSIILVLDTYHDRPLPGHAAYQVSRAAGVGLVRALASELAPTRVNAIAPGTVLPSERPAALRAESPGQVDQRTLLGRIGEVRDVVDAVLFARDAAYITGEVLRVDGGRFAA